MNTDFIPSATTSDFLDNNKIFWTTIRFSGQQQDF
jgi:hypothetical protein